MWVLRGVGNTLSLVAFMLRQSRCVRQALLAWGIRPDFRPGALRLVMLYCLLYLLDRYSQRQLREIRLFELIAKVIFYVLTVADDVLDSWGRYFTTSELRDRLIFHTSQGSYVSFSSEEFAERGASLVRLQSSRSYLVGEVSKCDPVYLVNDFLEAALGNGGIVDSLPLSVSEKESVREGLMCY